MSPLILNHLHTFSSSETFLPIWALHFIRSWRRDLTVKYPIATFSPSRLPGFSGISNKASAQHSAPHEHFNPPPWSHPPVRHCIGKVTWNIPLGNWILIVCLSSHYLSWKSLVQWTFSISSFICFLAVPVAHCLCRQSFLAFSSSSWQRRSSQSVEPPQYTLEALSRRIFSSTKWIVQALKTQNCEIDIDGQLLSLKVSFCELVLRRLVENVTCCEQLVDLGAQYRSHLVALKHLRTDTSYDADIGHSVQLLKQNAIKCCENAFLCLSEFVNRRIIFMVAPS